MLLDADMIVRAHENIFADLSIYRWIDAMYLSRIHLSIRLTEDAEGYRNVDVSECSRIDVC